MQQTVDRSNLKLIYRTYDKLGHMTNPAFVCPECLYDEGPWPHALGGDPGACHWTNIKDQIQSPEPKEGQFKAFSRP